MHNDKSWKGIKLPSRRLLLFAGTAGLAVCLLWSFRSDITSYLVLATRPAPPLAGEPVLTTGDIYMTTKAVDYVADMEVNQNGGGPVQHVTVYRSGNRQRQESDGQSPTSSLADLDAGYWWKVTRDASGKPVGLNMEAITVVYGRQRVDSGRFDRWHGEWCAIKVFTNEMPVLKGFREAECITGDGILLWHGALTADGKPQRTTRVTRLVRRRVTPSEVSLGGGALDLASYGDWSGRGTGANYAVMLKDDNPGAYNAFIENRRFGDLSLEHSPYGRRYSNGSHVNGSHVIVVGVAANGRVAGLRVTEMTPEGSPPPGKLVGIATIAGEKCRIYGHPRSDPSNVESFPWSECVTRDGIVLRKSGLVLTTFATFSAVDFHRGMMTAADVAPPPELLTGRWQDMQARTGSSRPSYISARWALMPSVEDAARLYPRRAIDDEVEGSVTVECVATKSGIPNRCTTIQEVPRGYGFGDATVKLFQTGARLETGTYRPGDKVRVTWKWTLP